MLVLVKWQDAETNVVSNKQKPKYKYSFDYQNWYQSAKRECLNTRNNLGFDLTPLLNLIFTEGTHTANCNIYAQIILKTLKVEQLILKC